MEPLLGRGTSSRLGVRVLLDSLVAAPPESGPLGRLPPRVVRRPRRGGLLVGQRPANAFRPQVWGHSPLPPSGLDA